MCAPADLDVAELAEESLVLRQRDPNREHDTVEPTNPGRILDRGNEPGTDSLATERRDNAQPPEVQIPAFRSGYHTAHPDPVDASDERQTTFTELMGDRPRGLEHGRRRGNETSLVLTKRVPDETRDQRGIVGHPRRHHDRLTHDAIIAHIVGVGTGAVASI